MFKLSVSVLAASLIAFPPQLILAQQAPATPAPSTGSPQAPGDVLLTQGQLEALVSPVALYPDVLLSEVLMASTYPLEVVTAQRWVSDNKGLKGDALKAAVDQQSWDDSVKSLAATPEVLNMMSDKLQWTQSLGDAVLAQQADVMEAVQRLRAKAQANNKLATTPQQVVTTEQQGEKQAIVIAPAQPDTMYVPYYDPGVVYGSWSYPEYPPYYWPAPGYIGAGLLGAGLAFGAGYALGRWTNGGYWGGGVNWGGGNININRNLQVNALNRSGGGAWNHNSAHRQGVRYNNSNVANKFGGNRSGAGSRSDFRGRDAGGRTGGAGANRPGGGAGANRPGGGAGANRLGGGAGANRPGGGAGANKPGGGANRPQPKGGNKARPGNNGGNRDGGGARPANGGSRPGGNGGLSASRPSTGARGGNAFGDMGGGRGAARSSSRGQASFGGGSRGGFSGGGGMSRGGGGMSRGGGGRGGGGGRRSDMRLKHDIVLVGRLNDGLGYYRFVYNGGHTAFVGVMAQEVRTVAPGAVYQAADGYLRVNYDKLGLPFETYDQWQATGAQLPAVKASAQ